jgi:thiamine biosynthesis lipoprotein
MALQSISQRHEFRSMGCDVVAAGASASEVTAIERLFDSRDRVFSRFQPDSELNRVNAAAGKQITVSEEFAEMLGVALEAMRETGGLVDPTLGAELEAAGYDADFAALEDLGGVVPSAAPRIRAAIRLAGRLVAAPAGVRLDLNGVVKGRTVDDALALLAGEGFVLAGGDLAVRGSRVAALPHGGTVRLVRGAFATSGTDRRRWSNGGAPQHHLIDPRTGAPSSSPWEQVTVCGLTCLGADIAAKAAFLLGDDGPRWLDLRGLPGRFVTADGDIALNHAWQRTLERAATCI